MRSEFDQDWTALSEEILSGMKEWRLQHPHATLSEMEDALDERLSQLRAKLLQDMALASAATDWVADADTAPVCPECGGRVERYGGSPVRHLRTYGRREIALKRAYGRCSACGAEFFPPG